MAGDFSNILDIIFQLESSGGTDKRAMTPDKYGALGNYRLQPPAFQDIQMLFPKKWGNKKFKEVALDDKLARDAADDYLTVIQNYLVGKGVAPTMDALLSGYQSGMGRVARGEGLGKYGKRYLQKARMLRLGE